MKPKQETSAYDRIRYKCVRKRGGKLSVTMGMEVWERVISFF